MVQRDEKVVKLYFTIVFCTTAIHLISDPPIVIAASVKMLHYDIHLGLKLMTVATETRITQYYLKYLCQQTSYFALT